MDRVRQQKRVLKAPYKKWRESEILALISFLKENRPIEKPTAQSYYRKYLEENNVISEWKHVRCKVKNMRVAYNNAKAMQNSTGLGTITEDETVQSVILKKCPLFYEYEDIFGDRDGVLLSSILDTGSAESPETCSEYDSLPTTQTQPVQYLNMRTPHDNCPLAEQEDIFEFSNQQSPASLKNSKQKNICCRTGLSAVLQVQSEILSMRRSHKETELQLKETELALQKEKLLLDKEKIANELALQREKFVFEKQKYEIESKRMEHQLQTERELRIMEINMKKEIALREIEMKERIQMENLKNK